MQALLDIRAALLADLDSRPYTTLNHAWFLDRLEALDRVEAQIAARQN